MQLYRVTISGDKWPSEYNVHASGWATAVGRAIREWQKKFKGSRTERLNIKAVRAGLKNNNE